MKAGRTLQELAAEVINRAKAKADFIAPAPSLVMTDDARLAVGDQLTAPVRPHAHGQIATFTEIPSAYYNRLLANDTALLAHNVNRWLSAMTGTDKKGPPRRMVRTLGGEVRALLSDGYRQLENEDLLEAILPPLQERGLQFMSCEVTETRLYLKAIDPAIERDVPTGRRLGDGSHVFFDTVCPAIIISNSEVGSGKLMVETGVYTRACTNLAMIGQDFKRRHVGARLDASDEVYALLSDKTKRLTNAAVWSQLRDVVGSAFDEARFKATADKLAEAATVKIEGDPVKVVERVGRTFSMDEASRVSVLRHLVEGGDLSKYGLHAAITRASQDVEDYDAATELERAGGRVIELPPSDWKQLAAAA